MEAISPALSLSRGHPSILPATGDLPAARANHKSAPKHLGELHLNLLQTILKELPAVQIVQARAVCTQFRRAIDSPELWKALAQPLCQLAPDAQAKLDALAAGMPTSASAAQPIHPIDVAMAAFEGVMFWPAVGAWMGVMATAIRDDLPGRKNARLNQQVRDLRRGGAAMCGDIPPELCRFIFEACAANWTAYGPGRSTAYCINLLPQELTFDGTTFKLPVAAGAALGLVFGLGKIIAPLLGPLATNYAHKAQRFLRRAAAWGPGSPSWGEPQRLRESANKPAAFPSSTTPMLQDIRSVLRRTQTAAALNQALLQAIAAADLPKVRVLIECLGTSLTWPSSGQALIRALGQAPAIAEHLLVFGHPVSALQLFVAMEVRLSQAVQMPERLLTELFATAGAEAAMAAQRFGAHFLERATLTNDVALARCLLAAAGPNAQALLQRPYPGKAFQTVFHLAVMQEAWALFDLFCGCGADPHLAGPNQTPSVATLARLQGRALERPQAEGLAASISP